MKNHPVAVVTGGSRGIGRGVVLALAREGFNCVVNYNSNADAAEAVAAEVRKQGCEALAVKADVSSREDRTHLVSETVRQFGAIDLLVNNAGVAPNVRADILDAGEESFDRLININLKGPYFLTQLVARQMIRQVQAARQHVPHIVNVSSISVYTASVNRGDYCLSKAAIAMTTKLYAARLAEFGINVYEIRPGVIETDMTGPVKAKYDKLILEEDLTPIRRWGQPDDIGRAVVAIAKGYLPFSTGEVINVDGGFHMHRL